jgi:hypothetical protein
MFKSVYFLNNAIEKKREYIIKICIHAFFYAMISILAHFNYNKGTKEIDMHMY